MKTLQQVEIAKDKIGLCAYHNLGIASSCSSSSLRVGWNSSSY
ncbi:hypothetical protein PARMER_00345 [Parabacteroides merdae ATCC 43184]|nr:hypothetical protein PARMER_00345 [Parabacteroides merdae ATCC 43184]